MPETVQGSEIEERAPRSNRARRAGRLVIAGVLVLLSAITALAAGGLFVGSIANSGYDPQTDRAPALLIAVAAFATAMGFAAITSAVLGLRARDGQLRPFRSLNLIAGTMSLIAIFVLFALAVGEH